MSNKRPKLIRATEKTHAQATALAKRTAHGQVAVVVEELVDAASKAAAKKTK